MEIAGGVAGLLVVLIEIGSSAKHTLPIDQVVPGFADPFVEALNSYGVGSLEIFCGIGRDEGEEGCELKLTGLYPSLDNARTATIDMGRPDWLIGCWRTDQSNSFRIVEVAE